VLGRLPDQPRERDERECSQDEELDVAEARTVEYDHEWPEREESEEDFADHGRGTLTFVFT
jgi:predicted NUDIX family NTP pyrophosphohydrolase